MGMMALGTAAKATAVQIKKGAQNLVGGVVNTAGAITNALQVAWYYAKLIFWYGLYVIGGLIVLFILVKIRACFKVVKCFCWPCLRFCGLMKKKPKYLLKKKEKKSSAKRSKLRLSLKRGKGPFRKC